MNPEQTTDFTGEWNPTIHSAEYTPAVSHPNSSRDGPCHRIGRYEVEAVLGRGGMGVAYRAWDPDLKRVVAVKTLRASDADESQIARFRTESASIARIRHPNIVQVFDVGGDEAQPFFAMEFCPGGSLADRLKVYPMQALEAARTVEQIARGVDAAHRQNVIHRDLKPGNVLLSRLLTPLGTNASTNITEKTKSSSSSANGATSTEEPLLFKVTDFGLAKPLDEDDGQTRSGAILGTPSYMAPEQAEGRGNQAGPPADIYSLGAILYECLTGRPPFRGASMTDTLDQVRHREPVAIRQLQPKVPIDLETIALKCLQKEPDKRYTSALAVAEDLQRFLDHRPILARPVSQLERARRWCRRNRLIANLIGLVALTFLVGLIATTIMWRRAQGNFEQSEESLRETFAAVNQSFVKLSEDRNLQQPHLFELRKELLTASRPYFESFVAKRKDDPAWKRELAIALAKIAFVAQMTESPEEGMVRWYSIIPVWKEYLREHPDSSEAHEELAKIHISLAEQKKRGQQYAQAVEDFETGLTHLRAIEQRTTYDTFHFEAYALSSLSELVGKMGKPDRSTQYHAEALEVQQQAATHFTEPLTKLDLGAIHFRRGMTLLETGYADAALEPLKQSEKLTSELLVTPSSVQPLARRNYASTLSALGVAYGRTRKGEKEKRIEQGELYLRKASTVWAELYRENSTIVNYQVSFAESEYYLAQLYLESHRFADGDKHAETALKLRQSLFRRLPQTATDLADSYAQHREIGAKRLALFQDDVDRSEQLADVLSRRKSEADFLVEQAKFQTLPAAYVSRISDRCAELAKILMRLNRKTEAVVQWERAISFADPDRRKVLVRERDRIASGDE